MWSQHLAAVIGSLPSSLVDLNDDPLDGEVEAFDTASEPSRELLLQSLDGMLEETVAADSNIPSGVRGVAMALAACQGAATPPPVPHWHPRGSLPGADRDVTAALLRYAQAVGTQMGGDVRGVESLESLFAHIIKGAGAELFFGECCGASAGPTDWAPAYAWARLVVFETALGAACVRFGADTNGDSRGVDDGGDDGGDGEAAGRDPDSTSAWRRLQHQLSTLLWKQPAAIGRWPDAPSAATSHRGWRLAIVHELLRCMSHCKEVPPENGGLECGVSEESV